MKNKEMKLDFSFDSMIESDIENSRTIRGLAMPIDTPSYSTFTAGHQVKRIFSSQAVNDDLIARSDVKLYLNHDPLYGTYARCKNGAGSMRLWITDRGLEFETEIPNTQQGDSLLEGIKRGDFDKVSATITAILNEDTSTYKEGEDVFFKFNYIRSIEEISILSVTPAFPTTEVEIAHSIEEELNKPTEEEIANQLKAKEELEAKLDKILEETKNKL